jgi:hypothetical protein
MTAATAVKPQYVPDNLELPLSLEYHHKTWHTIRDCPQLLAVKIGAKPAMFVAQLHYWLTKEDVGISKHGWRWIYNAEWQWLEQLPCFKTEATIGRIRRFCEQIGYVVSNNFNRNPLDRTKYSTLDYYLIAFETGWNPLGLDLTRSYRRPPEFIKGEQLRRRHMSDEIPLVYFSNDAESDPSSEDESLKVSNLNDSQNLKNGFLNFNSLHSDFYQDDPYSYNSYISTKTSEVTEKKEEKNCQEKIELNSSFVKTNTQNCNQTSLQDNQKDSLRTKIPPRRRVDEKINMEENSTQPEDSSIPNRKLYDWEVGWQDGKPVLAPDFIRWRAKTHYEPQGGQWAAAARGHAAAEIARKTRANPGAVAWMWQDFLEYAEKSASNALAHADAGIEPDLPVAFTEEIRDTETVAALLVEAKGFVEEAKVASLEAASREALPPTQETEEEKFWEQTRRSLEFYQTFWHKYKEKPNLERFLEKVVEGVQRTPGLIMTEDGPDFDPDYVLVPTPETDEMGKDNKPECGSENIISETSKSQSLSSDTFSQPTLRNALSKEGSMSAVGAILDSVGTTDYSIEEYELVDVESLCDDPWTLEDESVESVEPPEAIALARISATTVSKDSLTVAYREPTVNNPQGIKVGDWVDWDDGPGYLEQFAPFEVVEIVGEQAHLDLIEKPILLARLRKRDTT